MREKLKNLLFNKRGSLSLECAIIMPVILILLILLLSYLNFFYIDSYLEAKLSESTKLYNYIDYGKSILPTELQGLNGFNIINQEVVAAYILKGSNLKKENLEITITKKDGKITVDCQYILIKNKIFDFVINNRNERILINGEI